MQIATCGDRTHEAPSEGLGKWLVLLPPSYSEGHLQFLLLGVSAGQRSQVRPAVKVGRKWHAISEMVENTGAKDEERTGQETGVP